MATQLERSDSSKAAITTAAIQLVAELGPFGFSLADVAARAGVSRGLPAHYFHSRDGLMEVVARSVLAPWQVPSDLGLEALLATVGDALQQACKPSTDLRAMVALLNERGPSPWRDHAKLYWEGQLAVFKAHLLAASQSGSLRHGLNPDLQAQVIATTLWGAISVGATSWRSVSGHDAEALLAAVRLGLTADAHKRAAAAARGQAGGAPGQPQLDLF